ncbi:MAG: hypothetical protein ACRCR4_13810 [Thiotrichaceae bacterium]
MQRNYRQITPTHTTRPYKMGKSANSQEKGRLLVVPYFLTALLALAGVALVVASEMGAQS